MLGKVAEGAWVEVGIALTDQYVSFAKKVTLVADAFRGSESSDIRTSSGVRVPEMDSIVVWTDAVRNARNAIHFGADHSLVDDYDSVAILVIGGVVPLRKLYAIKQASEELSGSATG